LAYYARTTCLRSKNLLVWFGLVASIVSRL
jgi:hypothetical protein